MKQSIILSILAILLISGIFSIIPVHAITEVTNTYQATPTAQTTWDSGLTNNLVGYWPLDEGSGTTTKDFSGNGNTGTLVAGHLPTWTLTGCKFGSCLSFAEASSQYVALASASNFPIGSAARSVTLWANPDATLPESCSMFNYGTFGVGYETFDFDFDTGKNLGLFDGTDDVFSSLKLTASAWNFVALTYTASATSATVYLGTTSASLTLTGALNTNSGTAATISKAASNNYCNASLDDIKIYNFALSSTQEASLATATNPATLINGVEVYGTVNGVTNSAICGIPTITSGGGAQTCSGTSDSGQPVYTNALIDGAPTNSRWNSGGCSFTPSSSSNTYTCNYYKQLYNDYTATPSSPATWDYGYLVNVTGSYLGIPNYLGCSTLTTNGGGAVTCDTYFDYNSIVSYQTPIELWQGQAPTTFQQTTGNNANNVNYIQNTIATLTTSDDGSISVIALFLITFVYINVRQRNTNKPYATTE